jgi:hypothetical protein
MGTVFLAVAVVLAVLAGWALMRGRFLSRQEQQLIGHIGTSGSTADRLETQFGASYEKRLAHLIDQGFVEARPVSEDGELVSYHLTRKGEQSLIFP